MPTSKFKPLASPQSAPSEKSERMRHVFAQLMDGRSMREVAAAEGLSVQRIQQIVADEISRRDADPAEDHALLQIARLERAVELLGAQIDEGKAAVVPPFSRRWSS